MRYINQKLVVQKAIRPAEEFRSSTYNLGRRITEFVDHLFVKYPVPSFLYRAVLSEEGWRQIMPSDLRWSVSAGWERDVFFAAAQGRSVADVMQGRLTRKESHWFLQASDQLTIRQNVVWAKLVAAGTRQEDALFLVARLCNGNMLQTVGLRLPELAAFFATYGAQMDHWTRTAVIDYLFAAYRDASFTLKGRTLASVIELSRLWHATDIAGVRVSYVAWKAMFGLWEESFSHELVRGVELSNSRALAEEGRHQRHCVYMYADMCRTGVRSIVSLRWLQDEGEGKVKIVKRLTIEVDRQARAVCQVRGACNRMPDEAEMKALRKWMGDHGLTLRHV